LKQAPKPAYHIMKTKIFKRKLSFTRHTAWALLLFVTAIIIHSCKKDSNKTTGIDVTVTQAKTWYESTYSTVTAATARRLSNSTTTARLSDNLLTLAALLNPTG
jgi:hypothetical protein